MTLNDFSAAIISSGITTSRRTILPLYDWVATTFGTILTPRKYSNGTYTSTASFALDVYKVFGEIDAKNSATPEVREIFERYSNTGVPGMDPSAVLDACLHNLALTKSKIVALGACAPSPTMADGIDMIRSELEYCLKLVQEVTQ